MGKQAGIVILYIFLNSPHFSFLGVAMTPNSDGSQDEDDCSSLFGCMTSAAVSCLSGDTSSQQHGAPNSVNAGTTDSMSAHPGASHGGHLNRGGPGGKSKRSKEQKTTRVSYNEIIK